MTHSLLQTLVGISLVGALTVTGAGIAKAAQPVTDKPSPTICHTQQVNTEGADINLLCKIIEVGKQIQFGTDAKTLTTTLSDRDLIDQYRFTQQQVNDFRAILSGTYKPNELIHADRSSAPFYISNDNLKGGIFTVLVSASSVGPEALAATFVDLASMMGPVGTIVGAGVAVLGTGFFVDFAMKITGALVQNKGLAFYPIWAFPPLRVEIE